MVINLPWRSFIFHQWNYWMNNCRNKFQLRKKLISEFTPLPPLFLMECSLYSIMLFFFCQETKRSWKRSWLTSRRPRIKPVVNSKVKVLTEPFLSQYPSPQARFSPSPASPTPFHGVISFFLTKNGAEIYQNLETSTIQGKNSFWNASQLIDWLGLLKTFRDW